MPRFLFPTLLAATALAAPATGQASPVKAGYEPGQVIVSKARDGTDGRLVRLRSGTTVREAVKRLSTSTTAVRPNYVAHASQAVSYPNDPFFKNQWDMNGPFGIGMPQAWPLATAHGGRGGKGVTIAVLDTGVAYENYKGFRRAPDLGRFTKGYDFVDDDGHPDDEHGHGTHVTGTIAQSTGNRKGAAGIAYRATIMPVRVLDSKARGDTVAIARGIRYAASHGADVINMSFEYDSGIRAADIPQILSAIRYAHSRGVTMVAAAGNTSLQTISYPARAPDVISVSGTTVRGCLGYYSNSGPGLDVAAPGGGSDADPDGVPYNQTACKPEAPGRLIYQQTFAKSKRSFHLEGEIGTSMAAPHVTGLAALLIASKRVPRHDPNAVETRIKSTARDIGAPGPDRWYGYGLVDAPAALR